MKKTLLITALTSLLLSPALFAQTGVTGKWIFSGQGPQGPVEIAFDLKADGKGGLTGEVGLPGGAGALPLTDGKTTGNDLSFKMIPPPSPQMPPDMKLVINYSGKVTGDSLSLTATMTGLPEGMPAPAPQTQVGKRDKAAAAPAAQKK